MNRTRISGISLLEVLLSLAVFGMIGVAIAAMSSSGGQVWRRVEAGSDLPERATLRLRLREALESMPEVGPSLPLNEIFQSHDALIAFRSNQKIDTGWTKIWLSEGKLQVQYPNAISAQDLYPDVVKVSVSYFGRKSVRVEPTWHDDWSDAVLLPELIKVESTRSDGLANPPLTVSPAILTRQREISISSLVPPG